MSEPREEVLARVREALRDVPREETAADVDVPRTYRQETALDADLLELFAERVTDYQASVQRVSTADVPAAVASMLSKRSVHRLAVPADLPAQWTAAAGVDLVRDDGTLSHADLDGVDGVLTGCAVAVALTGTIVLDSGRAQGRRALTLVPDYHLCIVRADQVVGGVPEAVRALDPRRPLTWISGPSATSDIELSRVEGVHGPRTLDVLLAG
ncbi:MAG: LutC/YkgG family protein [Streptosporangiales bacterium]